MIPLCSVFRKTIGTGRRKPFVAPVMRPDIAQRASVMRSGSNAGTEPSRTKHRLPCTQYPVSASRRWSDRKRG